MRQLQRQRGNGRRELVQGLVVRPALCPTRCSRFGPLRVSDCQMPATRPSPRWECERVVEGVERCGLYQVVVAPLLGSRPFVSLAAAARPQSLKAEGWDADRLAMSETPPFCARRSSRLSALGVVCRGCRGAASTRQVLQVEMRRALSSLFLERSSCLQTCTLGGCSARSAKGNRQQGKKSPFQARGFGGFRSKPGVRSLTGAAGRDLECFRE